MGQLTVKSDNIFFRRNTVYDYIEAVDAVSGEVVCVQQDYNENVILGKMDALVEVEVDGKTMLIQKGLSLSPTYRPSNSKYSRPLADLILQAITEGEGVTKACAKFGISYATLMRWAEKNEEFGKALDKVRAYRAEATHDKILDIAKDLETKQLNKTQVEALKAAGDFHKWSAEKSSPQKYGGKVEKGQAGAVSIIIQTGISRVEEPITVEVEHESQE